MLLEIEGNGNIYRDHFETRLLNKFHRFVYYCWIFFCTYKYIFGNFLLEQREQIKCYLYGRDWSWFTSCCRNTNFFFPSLRFICTSRYTKVQIFIFFDAADICNNLGVQYARVRNLWNKIFMRINGVLPKSCCETIRKHWIKLFFFHGDRKISILKNRRSKSSVLITKKFYLWALCTLFVRFYLFIFLFFLTFTKFLPHEWLKHFYLSNNKKS